MTKSMLFRAAAALALLAWLSSSFWTVKQDQTGVVLRFGKVVRTVEPGFHLSLPRPFEKIVKVTTAMSRTMPVGFTMLEEVGVTTTDPSLREWLTGDTNIVKLEVTLYYTIADPVKYLFGVSDLSTGYPRDMAIRYLAEAVITESVTQMTIDEVLTTGKTALRNTVLSKVQQQINEIDLGVTLTNFNVRAAAPPPEAQNAFNEVTSAKSYRDTQFSKAEGARRTALPFARAEADRIVQSADGERAEIVGQAEGWATAFIALSESIEEQRELGMLRLWLQATERIFAQKQLMKLPAAPDGSAMPLYLPIE